METMNKEETVNRYQQFQTKRTCVVCGTEFEPKNIRRIYCSSLCRWRSFSIKKGGGFAGISCDSGILETTLQTNATITAIETNGKQTHTNANPTENAGAANANLTQTNGEQTHTNGKQTDNANPTENANATLTETNGEQTHTNANLTLTNGEQTETNANSTDEHVDYEEGSFVNAIAEKVNERGYDERFMNPQLYWPPQQAEAIIKVNTCLRCLLENTLKLSRYRNIPASDLRNVANGYAYILYSKAYARSGHPYGEIINEFYRKLSQFYKQYRSSPKLRLVLKMEDKIEIISMLHEIGNSVPKRKFSELFYER